MAYCTVPPTMQYSVNVDASQMMHQQQMYNETQLSSPLWTTASNDVSTPAQAAAPPMLLLMPPLPVQQLGQAMSPMSPISPSAMSPMSPNPMSPMSHNPLSPTALSPMSPVEFYPGSPTHMRNYHRSNSGASASDVPTSPVNTNSRSSKGPISKLQEFVQSSKAHPLPSSCAVLQWSHENRMAGSSLQFRATTSFLLDGVPHHVLGGWWPSKKQSQRDAAERALAFFIGVCGHELTKNEHMGGGRKSPLAPGHKEEEPDEVCELEDFVGDQLRWSCRWEAQDTQDPILEALCKATVEFQYLGVLHVFAGKACSSKVAAKTDTAKRVMWYLHAPGYENVFEVEQDQVKTLAQAIPEPVPGTWPPTQEALTTACGSPSTVASTCEQEMDLSPCSPSPLSPGQRSQAEQAELLERKTTVMRLQNRLQKIFAKQLTPGKSVWCWRYEKNDADHTFQASVHISLLDRTFTGGWASTHQAAQMEACNHLTAFLDKDFKM